MCTYVCTMVVEKEAYFVRANSAVCYCNPSKISIVDLWSMSNGGSQDINNDEVLTTGVVTLCGTAVGAIK